MSIESLIESMARELGELRRQIEQLAAHEVGTGWQTWTPTVTQGVAVAATVTYAAYHLVGKLCTVTCRLAITAAGVTTNSIIVAGLPKSLVFTDFPFALGTGIIWDATVGGYTVAVYPATATSVQFWGYNVASAMGAAPNFALANGDYISFTIQYETT